MKNVLLVLSKKDVLSLSTLLAFVTLFHEVFSVPELELLPACNQRNIAKDAALSSSKAPVVSPAKVFSTLVQPVVTSKVVPIVLSLSKSYISIP